MGSKGPVGETGSTGAVGPQGPTGPQCEPDVAPDRTAVIKDQNLDDAVYAIGVQVQGKNYILGSGFVVHTWNAFWTNPRSCRPSYFRSGPSNFSTSDPLLSSRMLSSRTPRSAAPIRPGWRLSRFIPAMTGRPVRPTRS